MESLPTRGLRKTKLADMHAGYVTTAAGFGRRSWRCPMLSIACRPMEDTVSMSSRRVVCRCRLFYLGRSLQVKPFAPRPDSPHTEFLLSLLETRKRALVGECFVTGICPDVVAPSIYIDRLPGERRILNLLCTRPTATTTYIVVCRKCFY